MLGEGWIDVSVPVRPGMPSWPGDPPVQVSRAEDMGKGAEANVSRIRCGAHAGTHVDAPLHFFRDGSPIDAMPPAALVGEARVIGVENPRRIEAAFLETCRIREGERILFKTANSGLWSRDGFAPGFVHLSTPAAEYLARQRVLAVGIDYLSVAGYQVNETEVHRLLLGAGVWILEGLDLSRVPAGPCDLICLPLRLEGCEGAPARALVRPRKGRSRLS